MDWALARYGLAFVAGAGALLLAGGAYALLVRKFDPGAGLSRWGIAHAGLIRGVKYFIYGMIGVVLANAGAIVTNLLTGWHISQEYVSLAGFLATSAASGAKGAANVAHGSPPPPIEAPALPLTQP